MNLFLTHLNYCGLHLASLERPLHVTMIDVRDVVYRGGHFGKASVFQNTQGCNEERFRITPSLFSFSRFSTFFFLCFTYYSNFVCLSSYFSHFVAYYSTIICLRSSLCVLCISEFSFFFFRSRYWRDPTFIGIRIKSDRFVLSANRYV